MRIFTLTLNVGLDVFDSFSIGTYFLSDDGVDDLIILVLGSLAATSDSRLMATYPQGGKPSVFASAFHVEPFRL